MKKIKIKTKKVKTVDAVTAFMWSFIIFAVLSIVYFLNKPFFTLLLVCSYLSLLYTIISVCRVNIGQV